MGSAALYPEVQTTRQQRKLHQCLCGYRPPNYSRYKKHLAACAEWRNRPNPRGMSIYRRAKARKPERERVPTEADLRAHDAFRRVLEANDLSLRGFSVLLRLLARRYGNSR